MEIVGVKWGMPGDSTLLNNRFRATGLQNNVQGRCKMRFRVIRATGVTEGVKSVKQLPKPVYEMEGTSMPMSDIPLGVLIHSIEMNPGQGPKLVKARGSFAKITRKREDGGRVAVRMPSGEEKILLPQCKAIIGPLIKPNYAKPKLYKAGQNRWKGIRPHVRGIAKNPVDHPHGGKTNGGRHPRTPWGKPARGYKTVRKTKAWILKY